MRWFARFLFLLLVLAVVGVAAGAFAYNRITQSPLPVHEGELTVPGLNGEVEILRDEWGVPHIYADNLHDLYFAQGYTQAQDRWWQMEFFRRTGRGEIQELTGFNPGLMGTDIFIRTVGWRRAAERDLAIMDDETRAVLQAFTDGINAYILNREPHELALEYSVLGLTGVNIPIKPWEPVDTVVWGKVMAWDLSSNQGNERYLSGLMEHLSPAMLEDYITDWPYGDKPTVIFEEDLPATDESFGERVTAEAGLTGLDGALAGNFEGHGVLFGDFPHVGSNNWAVSGDKSASGAPILANDPHLGVMMPSIWYEIGLHCQPISDECPLNVVGFTFSPNPGIIIGHNGQIAWGVTTPPWDTQDLYRITVNPENDLQYEWNGEWRDMTLHEETLIFGNNVDPITLQIRETHLGPIINDNELDDDNQPLGFNNDDPLALRWSAYSEPGTLMRGLMLLNTAQNWDDFREALRYWDSPAQNFVYADADGNIGYQIPGRIPVRAPGHDGLLPVDGSTAAYDWRGFVPFEHLPSVFNPERGFVGSANQALVPLAYYEQLRDKLADDFGEDAHYVFGYQWAYGYRGQRVVEMLEANDAHDFTTFADMQGDNKAIVAEELAPHFLALSFDDEIMSERRDWLFDWDYQMPMDSPQAALWANVWRALMENLYNDQLAAADDRAGGGSNDMWATNLLADEPDNVWWDDVNTEAVETRDDILKRALRQGYSATEAALGADREAWAWGDLHTTTFVSNPLGLSGIDLIEDIVNIGPYPTSGGSSILNATSWSAGRDDFQTLGLPSMRMIIDFDDIAQSRVIHTTGQSGHPFSPHYDDQPDLWRNIDYRPLLWTREQVEAGTVATLRLRPE